MIKYWFKRIAEEAKPFRFIISRLLKRSRLCRLLVIRRNNYILRFYPTALSAAYWVEPAERADDEDIISRLLHPNDVFIDVGANVGALTLCGASRVGSTGRVFSFEPHPRIVRYLEGNIALNDARQVTVIQCALGDTNGVIYFSDSRADDMNHVDDAGAVQVNICRLDEVLKPLELPVALLKIDVEGYELPVLRGATRLLPRTKAIYFESWEKHYCAVRYSTTDVISFLADYGFTVYHRANGEWQIVPAQYVSENCENLLAVRDRSSIEALKR